MAKKKGLVIVESPAKAKKIAGFLGNDYLVKASMGHVRDLPARAAEIPAAVKKESWSTLGVNVDAEFEPLYIVPTEKKKVVRELKTALKDVKQLILATDEDREGESIGWHLMQLLKPKMPVKRMVFSEITKTAIQDAIASPRELDEDLVKAQETRRVLDRLYGYTLSPLLWKKISSGLSAGRVQSVAVRLLVQRELDRLAFHSGTYWDLAAQLQKDTDAAFEAQLVTLNERKIATGRDFDESTGKLKDGTDVLLLDEEQAVELRHRLKQADWNVTSVESRQQTRKPYPPFTTSTLQQEANRKLGMTARQTMQVAQRLYENGHITYMRTDSVNLSAEAVNATRSRVENLYGSEYLSPSPRQYSTKSKSAQEAHEAIRPAGNQMRTGDELRLSGAELKLYSLIWKRTMATQMAEARLTFQTVTITVDTAKFRATGRHVDFPGFFRAYVEGVDDPEAALDDQESALPPLTEGSSLKCLQLDALSHETRPPARYTEATLVRTLEAEGIGRPSTYASIIGTIQDRGYVRKVGNQLTPTFTALAVTRLLEDYFPNLVDTGFTAGMEQTLDDIAAGKADRLPYLRGFYSGDAGLDQQVRKKEETIDPRQACTLNLAGFDASVRVGRYGPYFEKEASGEKLTASIPADVAPGDISNEVAEQLIEEKQRGPLALGMHPEDGLPVYLKVGPFGHYLQLGEVTEEIPRPKRTGLPKTWPPDEITLEMALDLLSLPRRLGHHPETEKVVNVGIGRFGPYVLHNKQYGNFDRKTHTYEYHGQTYNVLNLTLEAAVDMLKNTKRRAAPTPIRELGTHPDDGQPVNVFEGRYGPYVKHGKINATIPKGLEVDSITLEEALTWVAQKSARKGAEKGGKRATTKKASRRKPTKMSPAGGAKKAKARATKQTGSVARKKTRKKSGKKGAAAKSRKKPDPS